MNLIPCIECGSQVSIEDKFCKECGRSTRYSKLQAKYDAVPRLRLADDADLSRLIAVMRKRRDRKYPENKLMALLRSHENNTSKQMLIRVYNLDGGGKRTLKQVADEFRVSTSTVGTRVNRLVIWFTNHRHWQ